MNRFSSAAGLALAVVAILGPAGPGRADEQVPFRGRLQGAFTSTLISANPPIASVLLQGTGNATHLGRFRFAIPHQVNLVTRSATGSMTFIAANGDRLFANFSGQASPTPTPNVLAVVETATVTGGTGRFAGATGSFTVERLVDLAAGTTAGSFNGTISPPGRVKRP
jgi:hypothetical protein